MRRVHGEGGGREVLCTYCGQGFATGTRARQHEVKVHMEDNLRGTNLLMLIQCGPLISSTVLDNEN